MEMLHGKETRKQCERHSSSCCCRFRHIFVSAEWFTFYALLKFVICHGRFFWASLLPTTAVDSSQQPRRQAPPLLTGWIRSRVTLVLSLNANLQSRHRRNSYSLTARTSDEWLFQWHVGKPKTWWHCSKHVSMHFCVSPSTKL